MVRIIVLLLMSLPNFVLIGQGEVKDSICDKRSNVKVLKSMIVPSALIGFGIIGLESHTLQKINSDTKYELGEHIDDKLTIDDFSQYSPMITAYALHAFGNKGRHNLKDKTIILATSYVIMGTTVNTIKLTTREIRPDSTSYNSFPSGHTATAFMGAELLYQEYKDVSIFYGIAAYAVAAGTGFFRMYNNRHWLTDITAGAGIGILSTKIAYLIHPYMKKLFKKDSKSMDGMVFPTYINGNFGIGLSMQM